MNNATHKIFTIRDRITGTHETLIMAVNTAMAIRSNFKFVKQDPNFKDLELWEVGEMNNKTGKVEGHDPVMRSWKEYEFAENQSRKIEEKDFGKEAN